jgi:hypothetical protein
MFIKKAILFGFIMSACSLSSAAIACKPGMGNCPSDPSDYLPSPPHHHTDPNIFMATGYYSMQSPNCDPAVLTVVRAKANLSALRQAQFELGTQSFELKSETYNQECKVLSYEPERGKVWIVNYTAFFNLF